MYRELQERGLKCGENRVARIMGSHGIAAEIKRKHVITTNSKYAHPYAKNLINQHFRTNKANEVYVSDITYVATKEGWLYLAVVLDLYSRRVVGWATSSRLLPNIAIKAFNRACRSRKPAAGAIIHTDRGSQYACNEFALLAACYGFRRSMNSTGNCYDNAVMESFFHSLKSEWLSWHTFKTRDEAANSIFEYIETFYNRERRHSTLGFLSPVEYERRGTITKT
jgi:transposase InsO family protein